MGFPSQHLSLTKQKVFPEGAAVNREIPEFAAWNAVL
jgi:hypothetical protein